MLAPIRLTNAGSCPSRQRDCVAEPIRLANAAAPLLLRSQARRKAYRARSAETKGTAQLVLRTQAGRKEEGPHLSTPLHPPLLRNDSITPYNYTNSCHTPLTSAHTYWDSGCGCRIN